MMIDARGLDYPDSLRQLSSVVSDNDRPYREVIVIVDSHEKSQMIKGFAEILLGCTTTLEESRNSFLVKITGGSDIL